MSRYALALAALTLALVTGGCEDDPEPKIADPTSEATSEPTSEPPTSEPTSEPAADLTPEDTARSWLNGLSMAFQSGDFADVDRLSAKGCSTCRQFIDPVRETFANGGNYRTEPIRIDALKAKPDQPRVVDAGVEFPGGVLVESADAEPTKYPSSKEVLELTVGRGPDGTNVVTSVVFLS